MMIQNGVRCVIWVCGVLALSSAHGAGVRDFTRSAPGTAVNATQASELTLTLTAVETRPIQNWIRTAGTLDPAGRVLTTVLRSPDAELVQIGQRTRAYTVNSRTRMNLGRITHITRQQGRAVVEATLPAEMPNDGSRYLMEIVVERGPFLSIPNVSIIEEGDQHIVYVERQTGHYSPQAIQTGLQGELYTQVVDGLKEGDQVVSVGSFFVDAENKLKTAAMAPMPGMDHGSMPGMPGMDHGATPTNSAITPQGSATPFAVTMTDPASNARVKAPLSMIHVMFSGAVDPKASGFEVSNSEGKRVDVGDAMPMGANMLMAMPKAPLPAGTYKVKWHTVGADAKKLEGEFSFTVQ